MTHFAVISHNVSICFLIVLDKPSEEPFQPQRGATLQPLLEDLASFSILPECITCWLTEQVSPLHNDYQIFF